jgi:general secretion pathway protein G
MDAIPMHLPHIPPHRRLLMALLLAAPILLAAGQVLFKHAKTSREAQLAQSLQLLRSALQLHQQDIGHYPARLGDLVTRRYLRQLPKDPLTDRHDSWQLVSAADEGIANVFSSADGIGSNGKPYRHW